MASALPRRVLLLVLDGAGLAPEGPGNAVTASTLPWLFECMREHGYAALEASGEAVGLEPGQVGNSEAGHLTLGAGVVVPCMTQRIVAAYEDGSWAQDPGWSAARGAHPLHVVGLVSDAGVHAFARTIVQAVRSALLAGIERIVVHPVLDGVDSQAQSAPRLLAELRAELAGEPRVRWGVVQGRRSFCDRSGNLAVSREFVAALSESDRLAAFDPRELDSHLASASEASFPARRLGDGEPLRRGAPVLITSHRADRARQVVRVLVETQPVWMIVDPGSELAVAHVFFPPAPTERGLFSELAAAGLRSRRIAEKCKFPHVTYFFNGFDSEREGQGVCVPSLPEAELAAHPEMSVAEIAAEVVRCLADPAERVVVANLANLDQIGHLGDLALAHASAAAVQAALCRISAAAAEHGWSVVVTSDHGNADCVVDAEGRPHGSHTHAPVPLAVLPARGLRAEWVAQRGSLANVAAGVLLALGLEAPEWMEPAVVRLVSEG